MKRKESFFSGIQMKVQGWIEGAWSMAFLVLLFSPCVMGMVIAIALAPGINRNSDAILSEGEVYLHWIFLLISEYASVLFIFLFFLAILGYLAISNLSRAAGHAAVLVAKAYLPAPPSTGGGAPQITYHIGAPSQEVQEIQARALPAPKPDLMRILTTSRKPHTLIFGETGAGKTTLVQHLVKHRLGEGHHLLILDPHAEPGAWPQGTMVIGGGENFEAIGEVMMGLVECMSQRYKMVSEGKVKYSQFRPLTIYCGEWPGVASEVKEVAKALLALLFRSRKIGYRLLVDAQSMTVKSMGIEGQGDARKNMHLISLELEKGRHVAKCDELEVQGAGAFHGWYGTPPVLPLPDDIREALDKALGTSSELVPNQKPQFSEPRQNVVRTLPEHQRTLSDPSQNRPEPAELANQLRLAGHSEEEIARQLAIQCRHWARTPLLEFVAMEKKKFLRLTKEARMGVSNGHSKEMSHA